MHLIFSPNQLMYVLNYKLYIMKKIILPICAVAMLFTACSEEKPKETEPVTEEKEEVVLEEEVVETAALPEGWELTTNEEFKYAAVEDSIAFDQMEALSEKFGAMFGEVGAYLGENQIEMAGAPLSHWSAWNPEGVSVFDAGIPVSGEVEGSDRIQILTIPAGSVVKYNHYGSYQDMEGAYTSITEYFAAGGMEQVSGPWEIYVTDPGMEPDTSKWLTEIYFPVSE